MSEQNRTLIRKAEMVISDFASAGALNPEQADKFIRQAIKAPVMLQQVNVKPMKAKKAQFPKMRYNNQVLYGADEATALPQTQWATPTLGQVELDTQLFKAETRMSDEVLEDQIEQGNFKDTVINALSAAVGRDLEKVMIQGNTSSSDFLLKKLDGLVAKITSNTVNGGSSVADKELMRDIAQALPDEWANTENPKAFYTNRAAQLDYIDDLGTRETPAGDAYVISKKPAVYRDELVWAVPMMLTASSKTHVIYGDPQMIYAGFHTKIRLAIQYDAPSGVYIIVARVRFDVQLEEETAFVRAYDVTGV